MNLPSYFKDFLAAIEPSPSYKEDQQSGHKTLRKRLAEDEDFKSIHVRKLQIANCQMMSALIKELYSLTTSSRGIDGITFFMQIQLQRVGCRLIIVNDQNAHVVVFH